jgi:hypothetical protein
LPTTRSTKGGPGAGSPSARSRVIPPPVQELLDAGLCVLPARIGGKTPTVKWDAYKNRQPTDLEIRKWFATPGGQLLRNLFVVTGQISGVAVLDIDSAGGDEYWRKQTGLHDLMDTTTSVKTGKGYHYWFRLPEKVVVRSFSATPDQHTAGISFDLRAEGTGVIAPPSQHESGKLYTWIRPLADIMTMPAELMAGGFSRAEQGDKRSLGEGSSGSARRSTLSALLESPAVEGGRNNWLARVAGHYARLFWGRPDAYTQHVNLANSMLTPPLEAQEVEKTRESVWREEGERRKSDVSDQGFIRGTGSALTTPADKGGDVVFANFDVIARGFVPGEGYLVTLTDGNGTQIEEMLTREMLSDRRKFTSLLIGHGLGWGPGAQIGRYGGAGERVAAYLAAQKPPVVSLYPRYDWLPEEGGYLTPDGLIRPGAGAPVTVAAVCRPRDPAWRYRFAGSQAGATTVLREILGWHDDVVSAVFGAWWAACLVKFWIEPLVSQFPVMGLQAPSESGKSTGYFPSMLALSGYTRGAGVATWAALRDSLSSNRIGIVWVDDADDPAHFRSLIRQVTIGGSLQKKAVDFAQETATLVAPLLLSGESLDIHEEKALLDRCLLLEVPSPKGRMDPTGRLQWERIVDFRKEHPDLTKYAGWILSKALTLRSHVDELIKLRVGRGRDSDKWAVLRTGARILDEMLGEGTTATSQRVDNWVQEQLVSPDRPMEAENKLTLEHLPRALRFTGTKAQPFAAMHGEPPTPAFLKDGKVWFHPGFLAEWIERIRHGRVDPRVDSEEALRQQAHVLGLKALASRKNFRLVGGGQAAYWSIENELARRIQERSSGIKPDEEIDAGGHDDS